VSRGWLPGVLLLVGLGTVITVVATASNVSIHTLSQIHADAASLHDVGGTYVAGWTSPEFNPFVDGRFRLPTLLLTIIYLLSVTAIGAFFIGLIRGSERWPRAVRLLAGFLPGYLMVLAPLQVLFAAIGVTAASWIALLAIPTIAVFTQRRAVVATASGLRHDRTYRRRWLVVTATVGFFLLLCGLHHLLYGRYFMVPDSISDFLNTAGEQMRGVFGSRLAQWDQQSDEWVFNAPLMFYTSHGRDFLFPIYATEFVGLASFAALVFGVVHSFAWRRPLLAAGLTTGAVLASTPSILPWYQISLIGGQNPMLWLGHPGRMIGIVGPWVALLVLGRWSSPRAAAAILLTTAGLAFTSSSGTFYVVAAVALAGVWHLLQGRGTARMKRHVSTVAVTVLGLIAMATPAFVYWDLHQTTSPNGLGWVLAAGAVAAGLAALLLALTSRSRPTPSLRPSNALVHPAAWLAVLATGFVLSNNLVGKIADGQVRDLLASALPGYGLPLESRGYVSITSNLHFPVFTGQECAFTGHCVSFPYFLVAYGFLTVLALSSWPALGQRAAGEDTGPRRAAWLITVAAFICSLALVDFTGVDQVSAWVLTRFIEVPYYALLGFAAVAFAGSRSRVTAWAGAAVIAAWTVIPLAFSHVIPQLARNASWLIGVIN
jgi:hypothetical protein